MLCADISDSLVQSCHTHSSSPSAQLANCSAHLPKSSTEEWALLNFTADTFRAIGMHGYVVRPVEPTAATLCTNATTNALQFITLSLTTG
ncbi:uncharacterized protein APUU_60975S [Aspergillus puulaauensis]|uniref:Uncharacterized protein n=1 Tax=Aspergillus puulaauensis TaxID=1220207 RepID=A0A7R8ARB8_9EURO|nr:uncharacterized protein APUU_60975S [Aspergillus puulaauensis]BCS27927.1 hypothetical protein APUU_60975S [Aspergillus puulaauensis]